MTALEALGLRSLREDMACSRDEGSPGMMARALKHLEVSRGERASQGTEKAKLLS